MVSNRNLSFSRGLFSGGESCEFQGGQVKVQSPSTMSWFESEDPQLFPDAEMQKRFEAVNRSTRKLWRISFRVSMDWCELFFTKFPPPNLGDLGGGLQTFFIFTPKIGEMIQFWRAYVSDGLVQPPTSDLFLFWWLLGQHATSIKCLTELETGIHGKCHVLNLQGCHQLQQCHQCLWQGCSLTQNAWEN